MSANLIVDIEKEFTAGTRIQAQFSLPTDRFSILILFGPSGCGKTTVLRSLAGLERPTTGRITFNDQTWFAKDKRVDLSPQQRGIGFCFQDYALFPHLTVANNVAYGPASATGMLKQFDLEDIQHRYPHQISGGQQQRVALARSIARRPKLLLLDEPLSALDTMLRENLRVMLRRLLSEYAIPVVLVTHDRTEAIAMGDQIVVMDSGRVLQSGLIDQVFGKPKNAAVAKIVGIETVVLGSITGLSEGIATVNVKGTKILAVRDRDSAAGSQVYLCIKGEDVTLQRSVEYAQSSRNHIRAIVTWIVPEGALIRVGLDCGFELTSLITRSAREQLNIQQGDELIALIKASAIHVVDKK